MVFTSDLMISCTYCDPWHPICPSACLLWQPPFTIWIKSPAGQQIAWKCPCTKVGEELWAPSIQIHETQRWHGTSVKCTDHWEVKVKEGWKYQRRTQMVEIPLAIQRKMKNWTRVKTQKTHKELTAWQIFHQQNISLGGRRRISHFQQITGVIEDKNDVRFDAFDAGRVGPARCEELTLCWVWQAQNEDDVDYSSFDSSCRFSELFH